MDSISRVLTTAGDAITSAASRFGNWVVNLGSKPSGETAAANTPTTVAVSGRALSARHTTPAQSQEVADRAFIDGADIAQEASIDGLINILESKSASTENKRAAKAKLETVPNHQSNTNIQIAIRAANLPSEHPLPETETSLTVKQHADTINSETATFQQKQDAAKALKALPHADVDNISSARMYQYSRALSKAGDELRANHNEAEFITSADTEKRADRAKLVDIVNNEYASTENRKAAGEKLDKTPLRLYTQGYIDNEESVAIANAMEKAKRL